MHRIIVICYCFISMFAMVDQTNSFTLPIATQSPGRLGKIGIRMSSFGHNEGQSPAQKKQERMMEMASISGAKKIAQLGVEERTKRAMLAEAVEDRIFELVDDLEQLVAKSKGIENLSDEMKEEAVEIAKQTKALQVQYDDLVSGRPSGLLNLTQGDEQKE